MRESFNDTMMTDPTLPRLDDESEPDVCGQQDSGSDVPCITSTGDLDIESQKVGINGWNLLDCSCDGEVHMMAKV